MISERKLKQHYTWDPRLQEKPKSEPKAQSELEELRADWHFGTDFHCTLNIEEPGMCYDIDR